MPTGCWHGRVIAGAYADLGSAAANASASFAAASGHLRCSHQFGPQHDAIPLGEIGWKTAAASDPTPLRLLRFSFSVMKNSTDRAAAPLSAGFRDAGTGDPQVRQHFEPIVGFAGQDQRLAIETQHLLIVFRCQGLSSLTALAKSPVHHSARSAALLAANGCMSESAGTLSHRSTACFTCPESISISTGRQRSKRSRRIPHDAPQRRPSAPRRSQARSSPLQSITPSVERIDRPARNSGHTAE